MSRFASSLLLASLAVLVACAFPAVSGVHAAENPLPQVGMKLKLLPKELIGDRPAQLVVELDAKQPLAASQLHLEAPQGIELVSSKPLARFQGKLSETFVVRRAQGEQPGPAGWIRVELREGQAGVGGTILANDILEFQFKSEISLSLYFILGCLGIALGYAIRLLVQVLKKVPAPSPAPKAGGGSAGPITEFVQSHYYVVDFGVTLVLGFLVLVALLSDGSPPETGRMWPGALASGVGLGLLANSELITRIK